MKYRNDLHREGRYLGRDGNDLLFTIEEDPLISSEEHEFFERDKTPDKNISMPSIDINHRPSPYDFIQCETDEDFIAFAYRYGRLFGFMENEGLIVREPLDDWRVASSFMRDVLAIHSFISNSASLDDTYNPLPDWLVETEYGHPLPTSLTPIDEMRFYFSDEGLFAALSVSFSRKSRYFKTIKDDYKHAITPDFHGVIRLNQSLITPTIPAERYGIGFSNNHLTIGDDGLSEVETEVFDPGGENPMELDDVPSKDIYGKRLDDNPQEKLRRIKSGLTIICKLSISLHTASIRKGYNENWEYVSIANSLLSELWDTLGTEFDSTVNSLCRWCYKPIDSTMKKRTTRRFCDNNNRCKQAHYRKTQSLQKGQ